MRPLIEVQRDELWAVIATDPLWCPAFGRNPSKHIHDLRRFEPEISLQSDALAAKDIDYGQKPDLAAVSKYVVHEIHRPTLIDRCRLSRCFTDDCGSPAARSFRANCKAFFAIKARNTLDVDIPTLAPKQDVDPPLAVAYAHFCYCLDAQSQCNIRITTNGSVTNSPTINRENLAGTSFA